jgi:type IV secretory pathway VirB4 component
MRRLPRHTGSTSQTSATYPFHAGNGLGVNGIYLGTDLLAGGASYAFDPFDAYTAGVVTAGNMLIAGDLGTGKSATVKAFVHRSVGVRNRWAAIVDPKGEYEKLAAALGMTHVRLHPGGRDRLNPLDTAPAGTPKAERVRLQHRVAAALLGAVTGRELRPIEDAAIGWALEQLADRRKAPTLVDLVRVLRAPTSELAARAGTTPDQLARRLQGSVLGYGKLLDRSLRGMFDGTSNITLDLDSPGIVLDISAVYADPEALSLVMVAAPAWLNAALVTPSDRRRLQVLDEAWALLGDATTARYLQACWKLGRAFGVANVAVVHRLADLRSQADDGTATAKVTAGLLADTQTRVIFRQPPDQTADAAALLGLTSPEAELIGRLVPHRALWKAGPHTAVVHHILSRRELALCDTDGAMQP